MLWGDIAAGLLISGCVAAWVPASVWTTVFASHDPLLSKWVGPLVGPVVAIFTFVCSVGNVPLAAVLWRGGASFGGVIAFLFADLIVLPILDIYRRYYGWWMAAFLLAAFYVAMALSAYAVQFAFDALHLTPAPPAGLAGVRTEFAWDYTTWLNLALLVLAAILVRRFLTTGGPDMLKMMGSRSTSIHPADADTAREHDADQRPPPTLTPMPGPPRRVSGARGATGGDRAGAA